MKLQYNKLWVAIGLGILSGPGLAAEEIPCTLTPAASVVYVGQSVQLSATCDDNLTSIDWQEGGVSVTDGPVTLPGGNAGKPLSFTYTAIAAGEFTFSVIGNPAVTADPATVVVLPSAGVVASGAAAWSGGTAPTSFAATCGSANNQLLESAPTAAQQCDLTKGQPALFVTGPSQFSWSCISLTGGAEDSCYATRSVFHMVTTSASGGTGGSVSGGLKVAAGTSTTVTATPPAGWNTSWGGTCGGTSNGNTSYTTNAITAPCTVTAAFSAAPAAVNGSCGSANGQTFSNMPTANLCSAGSQSAVATGASSYTWTCGGSNGGTTANCSATMNVVPSVPAGEDPGMGAGLWVPPGMPNRTVADQSSSTMDVSYVPGCLNGQFAKDSSSACANSSTYTGAVYGTNEQRAVTLGQGRQLVLRYKTPPTITDKRVIKVGAWNGGNVVVNMKTWLSTSPTATYDSVPASCRAQSTTAPAILTASQDSITTSTTVWGQTTTSTAYYCKLLPNTVYYFGIEFPETVSGTNARFQIDEMQADFLK